MGLIAAVCLLLLDTLLIKAALREELPRANGRSIEAIFLFLPRRWLLMLNEDTIDDNLNVMKIMSQMIIEYSYVMVWLQFIYKMILTRS
jgi:hypothetical protein